MSVWITEMKAYVIKLFVLVPKWIAFALAGIQFLLFPNNSYLMAAFALSIAVILDVVTKYRSIVYLAGGFKQAVESRKIYSKTLYHGTKLKLEVYIMNLIMCGAAYRLTEGYAYIQEAAIFISILFYMIMFVREWQSILENYLDMGADVGWIMKILKRKERQLVGKLNEDLDALSKGKKRDIADGLEESDL